MGDVWIRPRNRNIQMEWHGQNADGQESRHRGCILLHHQRQGKGSFQRHRKGLNFFAPFFSIPGHWLFPQHLNDRAHFFVEGPFLLRSSLQHQHLGIHERFPRGGVVHVCHAPGAVVLSSSFAQGQWRQSRKEQLCHQSFREVILAKVTFQERLRIN